MAMIVKCFKPGRWAVYVENADGFAEMEGPFRSEAKAMAWLTAQGPMHFMVAGLGAIITQAAADIAAGKTDVMVNKGWIILKQKAL